jgi:hypothetical protein
LLNYSTTRASRPAPDKLPLLALNLESPLTGRNQSGERRGQVFLKQTFGAYATIAPQAIATSVFLEKQLTVPDGLFPHRAAAAIQSHCRES